MERGGHPENVFGRLPRRRPALRSPLRDRGPAFQAPPPGPEPSAARHAPASDGHGGGHPLEDLAVNGIGALTELVVLGIKLSGRAYGGVRGVTGRR